MVSAAVMKNTGVLFANDVNADRIKAVVGNFHRLGVVNSVVSCCDGRKFSAVSSSQLHPLLMRRCLCTGKCVMMLCTREWFSVIPNLWIGK
jgi:ribosomal RNA methyltransferase Nop2